MSVRVSHLGRLDQMALQILLLDTVLRSVFSFHDFGIFDIFAFKSIQNGLGFELADSQGRFISAEFDVGLAKPVHICSLYLPSGSSGDEAQARKDHFLEEYRKILKQWRDEDKSIIVCGDYNIVHKRIDIKNWSGNQKSSGCLPHERAWLDHIYDELGYVDTFREVRKEAELYSWWLHLFSSIYGEI